MYDTAASDKNVFRLRGQLSRLTGQVRDINPVTQPATGMNDEDPTDLHATPNPAGYVPESPTSSEVSTAVEEIPETSFASAGTLGVHGNSSGDTDEMEERSIEKMLADEVLGLKQERVHLLCCVKDYEDQQITLLRTIESLENRSVSVRSAQSPTRSTVINENAVLSTRLCNFQDQLGETRVEMAEELQMVIADQALMQEELGCALDAKVKAEQELEQLRAAFTQEAEDKDTKLAQAKECVNDVKDVVEILAKQLHDNQMELESEKALRAKADADLQEKQGRQEKQEKQNQEAREAAEEAKEASAALIEAHESIKALAQTNSELAQELQESAVHSEHVAAQLQSEVTQQHEIKRLNAEVAELRKEIQALAIGNANGTAREQDLKEEIILFQKREEALGEELEHLTGAVDERIEAYQAREVDLQLQLQQVTQERDQALASSGSGNKSMHQISACTNNTVVDEMARLKQMASIIETQRHETLRALELSPGRSPEVKNPAAADKQILDLETQVMQLQAERVRHDAEKAHYEAELEMYQQAELKRQQLQQSTDDRTDQLIANEEIEMENAVMKDALTKLRRDFSVLKADKEEAVVQADAIRGVLRKELDSLEGELTKALDERSRIMARSSPARIQELEAQVSQLQQDLEMSVATVSSLDAALRSEQDEKKLLHERLRSSETNTSATSMDLRNFCEGELVGIADPVSMAKMIQSYFGNIQAEMALQHEGDQDLQNSLRTMYNSLSYIQ